MSDETKTFDDIWEECINELGNSPVTEGIMDNLKNRKAAKIAVKDANKTNKGTSAVSNLANTIKAGWAATKGDSKGSVEHLKKISPKGDKTTPTQVAFDNYFKDGSDFDKHLNNYLEVVNRASVNDPLEGAVIEDMKNNNELRKELKASHTKILANYYLATKEAIKAEKESDTTQQPTQ